MFENESSHIADIIAGNELKITLFITKYSAGTMNMGKKSAENWGKGD